MLANLIRASHGQPFAAARVAHARAVQHARSLATVATHPHYDRVPLLEDMEESKDPEQRKRLPIFTLSRARGFLPRDDPIESLPPQFKPLESLLERMTIVQPNGGGEGLLALGQFGQACVHELRGVDLAKMVEPVIQSGDQNMISALFRDMCFLTSAYLLEPVDLHYKATGSYCAGRDILPREIAVPLKKLADALGHFPYMEYASSYALQNYALIDKSKGVEFDNLRLIRAFQDFQGSEAGFILVHLDMVAYTGPLVVAAEDTASAAKLGNRAQFNDGMQRLLDTYKKINISMETMWGRSRPQDYLNFRSFIFGTAPGKRLNALFPNGVTYQDVSEDPLHFRGESGANDSIIPLGDNLLEITSRLPENELTSVLREFRAYRPRSHREYIEGLEWRGKTAGVKAFAEQDPKSLALYILNVDQIREFRDRHWRFTKEYILKRTTYDLATGGSPISTYLPQNLSTVLKVLADSCDLLTPSAQSQLDPSLSAAVDACRERAQTQARILDREVAKLVKERPTGVQSLRGMGATEGNFPKVAVEQAQGARAMHTAAGKKGGKVAEKPTHEQEKPLQRGAVGCDGVG